MRLYAPLLLTLLAVGVRAASISDIIKPELEKKLISEEVPPAENVSKEPEIVDPANTVIDVENNLKNNVQPEDIPVKVIVEAEQPIVQSAEVESVNEVVEEEEIKRPLADLRNPGPAQHQEHETQNPEHHEDMERTVSSVKEDIQEAQVILRQGFQGVANNIQNWYANNEQVHDLQNSIESMQQNFVAQVQKLNETLQNFLNPDKTKPLSPEEEQETKKNFEHIETRLKTLENNFNAGVKSLSEGVQVVATLKDESGGEGTGTSTSSSTTTVTPANFVQYLGQIIGNLSTTISSGFNNMTQAMNSFVTQNQPNLSLPNLPNFPNLFPQQSTSAAPLADAPVDGSTTTATQRPSPWQNIQTSFNNLFNPNQTPQTAQNDAVTQAPTGTFNIPALPIITSIVNFMQRPSAQTTAKPAQATQVSADTAAGSNVVPPPVKPEEIKTPAEKDPEPVANNPIRKLIENSPAVKGINEAVQRIQAINSPDKPRDVAEELSVKAEETKAEPEIVENSNTEIEKVEEVKIEAEKTNEAVIEPEKADDVKFESEKVEVVNNKTEKDEAEQEKGGFYYPYKPGKPGDHNDSGERVIPQEEEQKAPVAVKEVKETQEVSDKTE